MRVRKIIGAALGGLLVLTFLAWFYAISQKEPPATSRYLEMNERIEGARLGAVAVAPASEALTFARYRTPQGLRLVRVERYENGQVTGVDISALQKPGSVPDPITLWAQSSYEAIASQAGPAVSLDAAQLVLPFDGTEAQIAMGGTYREHAKETTLEKPFVFPKLRPAQPWNAPVPVAGALLDYEIELGFVALRPVAQGASKETYGLVLASDYTDRAVMLREIDLSDTHSGEGFSRAKSLAPMPVGALFVVPRDLRSFYKKLDMRLYVNGRLRQIALPKDLTWDIDQMVQESFSRRNRLYRYGEGQARLPIGEQGIPARTLVLSGTTDGVAFRPPSGRQLFIGVVEWLASLRWANPRLVVERSLTEARNDKTHLQPGDTVLMRADYLGFLANPIVP